MRAKRLIVAAGSVGALVILAIFSWNYLLLQAPLSSSLSADPRNEGIVARAHFGSYVQPHVVIFDLRSVASEKSPSDVFRAFLQFSQALKHREFDRVVLAHRGESKFLLEGAYFRQLGNEYANQNPMYTVRTFPEHLNRMDGNSAYGQWTGGLLGVLKGQMEDFTKFHRQWYIDDLASISTQK